MSTEVRQFTVQHDDDGVRLDRWFKRHLPDIGFAMISRWARTGQIRIDGKRADPADRVSAGQVVREPPGGDALNKGGPKPRRELSEEEVAKAEAMVITQDRAAIVLNKPPGLATQGGTGIKENVDGLLDAFGHDGPRPRLVHRLDKDTSGVLLIARTPGSAAYFSKRFSGRTARKIYWAIITGVPEIADGLIELPLAKQPGTGGEKMMVDESGQGQSARTRYRVLDRAGNRAAWVELQPLTGRTHQLRVHMAAIGHPIVGDGKYGGPDAFLSGSISRKMHLHARRLIIDHPDGDQIDVTADLPEHFANTMDSLGFDEEDGAALPERFKPGKAEEKSAAKAHAKQFRKERRGERRGGRTARAETAPTTKRGPTKGKGSPKPAAGKPGPKPAPKAGLRDGPRSGPKAGPRTGPRTGPRSGPRTGAKPGPRSPR